MKTTQTVVIGSRKITVNIDINEAALAMGMAGNLVSRNWRLGGPNLSPGKKTTLCDGAIVCTAVSVETIETVNT